MTALSYYLSKSIGDLEIELYNATHTNEQMEIQNLEDQ